MNSKIRDYLKNEFGISQTVIDISDSAEKDISETLKKIDAVKEYNQVKVIRAMQKNNLSDAHFGGTTGYGYNDRGREVLDSIYADVFRAQSALVRHQIVSGTHALALCMYGILRPGDELLSVTGKPYDTLEEVIGIRGEGQGSLKEFGITYRQVELKDDGKINLDAVGPAINQKTRLVLIQRSRGYSWRPSLSIDEIGEAVKYIKSIRNDIVVMVDNCYGEFVEDREPTEVGADLAAGSLIKNPGGGQRRICEYGCTQAYNPGTGERGGFNPWSEQAYAAGTVHGSSCCG